MLWGVTPWHTPWPKNTLRKRGGESPMLRTCLQGWAAEHTLSHGLCLTEPHGALGTTRLLGRLSSRERQVLSRHGAWHSETALYRQPRRSRTTAVPCAQCARGLGVPQSDSDLEPRRLPEEEVVKEWVVLDQQVKHPIRKPNTSFMESLTFYLWRGPQREPRDQSFLRNLARAQGGEGLLV